LIFSRPFYKRVRMPLASRRNCTSADSTRGKAIAWLYTPDRELIELLEQ